MAADASPVRRVDTVEVRVQVGNATARARKDLRGWWVTVDNLDLPPICRATDELAIEAAGQLATAYDQILTVIRFVKADASEVDA